MNEQFTASVYCNEEQIAVQAGDNVDKLLSWMLIQVNGHFGDVHGQIIDNQTHQTIKTFRKASIE